MCFSLSNAHTDSFQMQDLIKGSCLLVATRDPSVLPDSTKSLQFCCIDYDSLKKHPKGMQGTSLLTCKYLFIYKELHQNAKMCTAVLLHLAYREAGEEPNGSVSIK